MNYKINMRNIWRENKKVHLVKINEFELELAKLNNLKING